MARFGPKVGQIGPKWDKSGTFSDQISVHFNSKSSKSQDLLKSDLIGPRFVSFGSNLTHFGPKSAIPSLNTTHIMQELCAHRERLLLTRLDMSQEVLTVELVDSLPVAKDDGPLTPQPVGHVVSLQLGHVVVLDELK